MRRLLLPLAALLAAACARTPSLPPSGARPPAVPVAPPGFEQQAGESSSGHDVDGDGNPDVWTYVLRSASGGEILIRKEKDLDGDGRVDTWEKYREDGGLFRIAHDLDLDGRADVIRSYEKDQLVTEELPFELDGVPRTRSHYENGKLRLKERDTDRDGKFDVWEHWESGELDRIGADRDGDGRVDSWQSPARVPAAEPADAQK